MAHGFDPYEYIKQLQAELAVRKGCDHLDKPYKRLLEEKAALKAEIAEAKLALSIGPTVNDDLRCEVEALKAENAMLRAKAESENISRNACEEDRGLRGGAENA